LLTHERRLGFRVPLEIFLNQYVRDRLVRGLTCNISDTGMYLQTAMPVRSRSQGTQVVGLEFELPGTGDVIWARGEICHVERDGYAMGTGIRFTAMPRIHAHLLRDFCVETRRTHLSGLLARIREPGRGDRTGNVLLS
jgi:hypothetical protein